MRAFLPLLCAISFAAVSLFAQTTVNPDSTSNGLYRNYQGQIVFLPSPIPIEQLAEKDFIDSFNIGDTKDLDIRIFMRKPLINYLHELNTSMSEQELLKNGNFQFKFFADEKLIYSENLSIGAGTVLSKTKRSTFRIPLISSADEDSWGRFLWARFYFGNGGEDALFSGPHRLKIEIRPYLKLNNTIVTGDIIARGEVRTEAMIPGTNDSLIAIQKIASKSGWKISKSLYDTARIRDLNRKIYENRFRNITSITVIKNGELLIEEYFNGSGRATLHDTRSVGKSFASTLTGIAILDGYIKDEHQTLREFYDLKKYAHYSPLKEGVSLKSLLTMSSGFDGSDQDEDSPGNEENMYPTDNWVKFGLDLPMDPQKTVEKNWDYFTAGVVMLGDILHQRVPGGLEAYADKKLFKPMAIKSYKWQYTPQNVVNTAGGLALRSLDLAKYGQLYQNRGFWNGKQVLPGNWVDRTFTNYFENDDSIQGYGYLFWKEEFDLDGKTYEAFACSGNGGNKVYIFRNIPLVIVITSTAFNKIYAHPQVRKIMQDFLLPAVLAHPSR